MSADVSEFKAGGGRLSLCTLCQRFISGYAFWGLDAFKCGQNHKPHRLPARRWFWASPRRSVEDICYGHHKTETFLKSAQSCSLCRFILDGLDFPDELDGTPGLHLWPFHARGGGYPQAWGVKAVFRNPDYRRKHPSRLFRVSWVAPYDYNSFQNDGWYYYYERAIPESAMSSDAFHTMRFWLRDCIENHPKCHPRSSPLPTRVVDVGIVPESTPVLYTTKGEEQPYAALSHCWGGNLPLKTVRDNLRAHHEELPSHELPRNFLDAIRTTRELGLRYLWIDALCIIQDDPGDWQAEATAMASIYNNATLTISTLDSSGPEAGFLKPRRNRPLWVGSGLAVHSLQAEFPDAIEGSVLNGRAWCMQERLLSPAVLHFGQDQMYWECCTITALENSGNTQWNTTTGWSIKTYNRRISNFTDTRKSICAEGPRHLGNWDAIVEEYCHRKLTYRSDKLPALAGAATLFRSAGLGGAYIAGVFRENLNHKLCWSGRTITGGMRKATGFGDAAVLTKPTGRQFPSWSWASVDGDIEFHPAECNVLDIKTGVGYDDLMATTVEATLKIRGILGPVSYLPNEAPDPTRTKNVGLIFKSHIWNTYAVMDIDRTQKRDCWALISAGTGHYLLLLEEVSPDVFRRIGWSACFENLLDELPDGFKEREFDLI